MTLYDLLKTSSCNQKFSIYLTNNYDQNLYLKSGTLEEILNFSYCDYEIFDHLMDTIEFYRITKDYRLVVFISDKNFDMPLEEQYSKEDIATWNKLKAESRPWRYSTEVYNTEKIVQ